MDIAAREVFLKSSKPLLPFQRGLENPPLELFPPLFVALEGSKLLAVQFNWTSCNVKLDVQNGRGSDGAGGSIAARQRTTRSKIQVGEFKNWRQWQTPAS